MDRTTQVTQFIKSEPHKIYAALIDPNKVAKWKFPDGMAIKIHEFNGYEGGTYRISLTYTTQPGVGKTSNHTDTYHGHFTKLIPDQLVVSEDEFETNNPKLTSTMLSTIRLQKVDGGTNVTGTHENLPTGVPLSDNEEGWRLSLKKLAKLVEAEL